ncbi:TPA: hypothetical protein ACGTRQ_005074 [Vibrio parahaemolyticus]
MSDSSPAFISHAQPSKKEIIAELKKTQPHKQTIPLSAMEQEQINDSKKDRELKESYAKDFKTILATQLAVMNIIFIGVGFGWLRFEKLTIDIFMTGTMIEAFGIVVIITKNLFPQKRTSKEPS